MGIIGYILGLYRDNGKEHGNYYNGLYRTERLLLPPCWLYSLGVSREYVIWGYNMFHGGYIWIRFPYSGEEGDILCGEYLWTISSLIPY